MLASPAQTGIQNRFDRLGSRVRGNDAKQVIPAHATDRDLRPFEDLTPLRPTLFANQDCKHGSPIAAMVTTMFGLTPIGPSLVPRVCGIETNEARP